MRMYRIQIFALLNGLLPRSGAGLVVAGDGVVAGGDAGYAQQAIFMFLMRHDTRVLVTPQLL